MATSVLGSLAVYLTADTQKFQTGMISAERKLMSFKNNVFKVLGAVGIGFSAFEIYKKSMKSFQENENAVNGLSVALENNKQNVSKLLPIYENFADQLQRITKYTDEEILNEMSYGIRLGITSDKIQQATKSAIGLSSRLKIDLHTAMLMIYKASMGNTDRFARLGLIIDKTKSKQEQFNEVLKIGSNAFGLAEGDINTLSGATGQLNKALDEVFEQFGRMIGGGKDLRKSIADSLFSVADYMKQNQTYVSDIIAYSKIELKSFLNDSINNITNLFDIVSLVGKNLMDMFSAVGKDIFDFATSLGEVIIASAKTSWDYFKEFFNFLYQNLKVIGSVFIDFLSNPFRGIDYSKYELYAGNFGKIASQNFTNGITKGMEFKNTTQWQNTADQDITNKFNRILDRWEQESRMIETNKNQAIDQRNTQRVNEINNDKVVKEVWRVGKIMQDGIVVKAIPFKTVEIL